MLLNNLEIDTLYAQYRAMTGKQPLMAWDQAVYDSLIIALLLHCETEWKKEHQEIEK